MRNDPNPQILSAFASFLQRSGVSFERDVLIDIDGETFEFPICIEAEYGKIFVSTVDRIQRIDTERMATECGFYFSYFYPNLADAEQEDEFREFLKDWSIFSET